MQLSNYESTKRAIIICIFALLAIFYLTRPLIHIPFKIGRNYNEGWNALHAKNIFNSKALYPKYTDLTSNNYPPISFYIYGGIGLLLKDNIIAGRIVALFSFIGVSIMIMLLIKQFSGSNYHALISGLFFIGYMADNHELYIAMNDPQWLGHCFQITGFLFFLISKQKGNIFYLSILMIVISGMIKHNIISLPIAITAWLLIYNRPALLKWFFVSLIFLSSFLFIFSMLHGMDFIQALFVDCRNWDVWRFSKMVEYGFTKMLGIIGLGVIGCLLLYPSKYITLLILYLIISAAWGAFTFIREGVGYNAVYDFIIALTLIIGFLLNWLSESGQRNFFYSQRLYASVIIILILTLATNIPQRYYQTKKTYRNISHESSQVATDIALLTSKEEPIICENLSLCYWANKDFKLDFSNTGQKIRSGIIDKDRLVDLFEKQYFSVIQLNNGAGDNALTKDVNKQIFKYYKILRTSPYTGVFLVPKPHLDKDDISLLVKSRASS